MTTRRKTALFIAFYIGIILAILFTHFYILDIYGHNRDRRVSVLPVTQYFADTVQFPPAFI